MVGRIFGNYRTVAQLGEGGMGIVYLAEHVDIGKRAAIKVLHPELLRSAEAAARFIHEAKAVAAIRHENIVDITDFGRTDEGDTYYIMELLEGETLAQRLRRETTLQPPVAVDVIAQAASALGASHARGIVHRDLKPDNLFLTRLAGRDPFVKVLDFGIAKVVNRDAGGPKTRTGVIVGTPQYMAPEQCAGKVEIDGRVDLYALGMILYQTLCGRVAFDAGGFTDTLLMQITQPVPPPRSINPYIPEGIEAVILRCLEKDREHRFASTAELLAALAPFLRDVAPRVESAPTARSPRVSPQSLTAPDVPGPAPTPHPSQPTTLSGRAVEVPTWKGRRGAMVSVLGVAAVGAVAAIVMVMRNRPEAVDVPARPIVSAAGPTSAPEPPKEVAAEPAAAPAPRGIALKFRSSPTADVVRVATGEKLGTTPFEVIVPTAEPFDVEFRRRDHGSHRVHVMPAPDGVVSATLRRKVALLPDDLKGPSR